MEAEITHMLAVARSWKGTRFAHQGRVKAHGTHKGGVDCLGLLVGVAQELGLPHAQADECDYGHIPDAVRLYARLCQLMQEKPQDTLAPGDVVLLKLDGNPQHLALVSDYGQELGIIHAYAPARAVVEHRLDDGWRAAIHAVFRLWPVDAPL